MADGTFAIKILVQQQVAKELGEVEADVKKFKQELEKATAKIDKLERKLKDVGKRDEFKKQSTSVALFGQQMGVAIRKLLTYRAIYLGLATIANFFQETFRDVVNLDAAFQDLQKVLRGTEDELERLRKAGFTFAKQFGRPVEEVIAGFKTFAQQGLDVNGVITRTNALMIALAATTLGTKEAIEALTAASENFALEGTDLIRVIDKWLAVEREFPVAANDFANALKGVGQVAAELNLTIDELNGVVAAVGEVTRKSGTAIANSFRTIFARISSDKAIKSIQRVGVSVVDLRGNIRPLGNVIRDLGEEWDNLSQAQRINIAQALGQKRRYTDVLALFNNLGTFLDATTVSQNALNDAALAATVDTAKLQRQVESVSVAWKEFRTELGEEAVRSLIAFSDEIINVLKFLRENNELILSVVKSFSLLLGILAGRKIFGFFAKDVGKASLALKGLVTTAKSGAKIATVFGKAIGFLGGRLVPVIGWALLAWDAFKLLSGVFGAAAGETDELTDALNRYNEEQQALVEGTKPAATAIDKLNAALARNVEFTQKSKDVVAFIRLKEQAEELEKTDPGAAFRFLESKGFLGGMSDLEAAIARLKKDLDDIYDELSRGISGAGPEDIGKGFTLFLDRAGEKVAKLEAQFKQILSGAVLDRAAASAARFGEAFNPAETELKQIQGFLSDIENRLNQLKSEKVAVDFELGRQEEGKTFDVDQLAQLQEKQKELNSAIERTQLLYRTVGSNLGFTIGLLVEQVRIQKIATGLVQRDIAQRTGAIKAEQDILRTISSIEGSRTSNLQNNTEILSRQQAISSVILELDKDRADAERDIKLDAIRNSDIKNKEALILDVMLDHTKKIADIEAGRKKIAFETVKALLQQSQAIQSSIRSGIVGGLQAIPDYIRQRKDAEHEIFLERKLLEFNLAEARKANDQAAINQALEGLAELEERGRRLGSVAGEIAQAFLEPLASTFFEKNLEALTQSLLDIQLGERSIGNRIAGAITRGATTGAEKLYNEIIDALNAGGDSVALKIETAFANAGFGFASSGEKGADALSKTLNDDGTKPADAMKTALAQGAQLISSVVGQSIGGGGKGAQIGSQLGAFAGSLIPGAGIAGALGGGLVGGFIGGLFDSPREAFREPLRTLTDSVNRNTIAIENNNRLLELNREFINAPTRFVAPPTQGGTSFSGGINIQVFANTNASPTEIGEGIADVLEKELGDSIRQTRSTAGTLGVR